MQCPRTGRPTMRQLKDDGEYGQYCADCRDWHTLDELAVVSEMLGPQRFREDEGLLDDPARKRRHA
jgi:hypothetical protein